MTSCDDIRPQLIAYHFNVAALAERDLIEAHLADCRGCVAELIAVKRAIELGEDGPRPSDAARARLRATIAAHVAGPARRWWDRPVAFAFAGAAILAAMIAMRAMTAGPGSPPSHALEPAATHAD